VGRRFDRAAPHFDEADFVHRYAARGLIERMSPMLVDVQRILDAGAATGAASRELADIYRRSHVIGIDRSANMLQRAKRERSGLARIPRLLRRSRLWEVRACAAALPLRQGSIDLAFANMLLPWIHEVEPFFAEIGRVLRKDGLFVFSTLGPDSLLELRQAWASIDDYAHVNTFIDMHDVGDALLRAGLREPVLDTDYLTVRYRSADEFLADLTRAGARNSLERRRTSLTGKNRIATVKRILESSCDEGSLSFRLELVFGHAWGGGPRQSPGEFAVDVSRVGRRSR
jgi:malonyl-CoA O-methyltransferase